VSRARTRLKETCLRILLASPYDLTYAGGVTSHIFDLSHEYQRLGHEVLVTGPSGDGSIPQNGFTQHLGSSFRFLTPGDSARINLNPLISSKVQEVINGKGFDVYHLHEPFLGFIGASFLRHGKGIKVGTFHTWRQGPHLAYLAFRPLVLRWDRYLHGRTAVSDTARETINRYVPGDYRVIPNAISFDAFASPVPPPAHLNDDRPTILFVGRIEARKGIPFLLRAYRRVKAHFPNARLVIAGEGRVRNEYEQLAETLGLKDVHFEGYVPRERLPHYYQRANVFCSPSVVNESFGITLLEAMAAGAPSIATSINGLNTLGEDGVTGLIVPPKDEFALADAIEELLEDRPRAAVLARAAQERARQFDWSVIAQQLLAYYEEMGSTPAGRPLPGLVGG
jgi:phosphatidyl-myo-inositol alpha-mannosyltransferase